MLKECSGALHKDTLWGQNESLKPLRGRERNNHWHPGKGSPPQENSHQSCGLPEENDIKWAPHFTLLLSPTSCQSGEPPESRRLREPLDGASDSSAIQMWNRVEETDGNLHRQVENFPHPVLGESKPKEGLEHREPGTHIQRPGFMCGRERWEIAFEVSREQTTESYIQPDKL